MNTRSTRVKRCSIRRYQGSKNTLCRSICSRMSRSCSGRRRGEVVPRRWASSSTVVSSNRKRMPPASSHLSSPQGRLIERQITELRTLSAKLSSIERSRITSQSALPLKASRFYNLCRQVISNISTTKARWTQVNYWQLQIITQIEPKQFNQFKWTDRVK